jgi:hypothetical protein
VDGFEEWFEAFTAAGIAVRSRSFRAHHGLGEAHAWDHLVGQLLRQGWREVGRGTAWWERRYERS